MDNQRIIQVLQDLLNNQNSVVSNLNQYLSEAYNTSNNCVNFYDYQNLQNDNNNLNNRISELTNTINSLQNDYQNYVNQASNNNNSYELEALRSLVTSLTQDKDYLQNQLNGKDQQIVDAQNSVANQITNANNTINDLQNQVTELNAKLTDAINTANEKQAGIDTAAQKSALLHEAIENVKAKVEEELNEALRDIDSSLDTLKS